MIGGTIGKMAKISPKELRQLIKEDVHVNSVYAEVGYQRLLLHWIETKSGCLFLNLHPRFIEPQTVPIPTRLLISDQIDNKVHVVNATSNNGAARNYLHGKFGKFINLMKVGYLCRREHGNLQSAKDDIYLMMENLVKSKEISFVSLGDVPRFTYEYYYYAYYYSE